MFSSLSIRPSFPPPQLFAQESHRWLCVREARMRTVADYSIEADLVGLIRILRDTSVRSSDEECTGEHTRNDCEQK